MKKPYTVYPPIRLPALFHPSHYPSLPHQNSHPARPTLQKSHT
ncbi:hypothetical protein HMPREF6485_1005 [Segatella buccae ATCC 33574]|uniref:Uncharacterized protein n=1 Tax=Segatella buccae ATCC 33574 TaxID=873513 RepID=E6K5X1_9BACT|nr:hypothetical protein HMPREF6485_1005 [Segatella buccae ATCC 33574]